MTVASSGGGGGGGGDASAANQTTQITAEQAVQSGIGAAADAAATQGSTGSVNAKLRTVTSQLNTGNTSTASVDTKTPALVSGRVPVDGSGVTQPVSNASLPLPAGASTETTLSSLNSKVTAVNTGAVTVSSSALPTGAATAAKQPALGTAVTSASTPVNIASDQTVPVSASSLPLPSGAATSAKQPALGAAVTSASTPVNIASDQVVPISASALPLPSGAATAAKQPALGAAATAASTPVNIASDQTVPVSFSAALSSTIPLETTPFLPVCQAPQKTWRSGFDAAAGSGPDTVFMTAIANGSGIAVSQSGGNLVITSGTTAYSETILRSVPGWFGAFKNRYSLTLSQRIINCEIYLEFVDVIGDGLTIVHTNSTTVVVTIPSNPFTAANVGQGVYIGAISVASSLNQRATIASVSGNDVTFTGAGFAATGTGTCSLFGWNFHHVYYDNTTATSTKYGTQRNGWTSGDATVTINTTATGHLGLMTSDAAKAAYFDQLSASSTTVELAQRGSSVRNVPEDQTTLRLQIRVRNLAVSPASTTTITFGFLEVDQFIPQQVSLIGVEAQSVNQALGVQLVGTTGVLGTVSTVTAVTTVSTVTTVTTLTGTTTLTPGVGATNLGKAEDAVAASGDSGVAVWGVRRDVATISASASGDYNELAVGQFGDLTISRLGTRKRTYSCAFSVVAAAAATDVVEIIGSASTTVEISRVTIGGVQTAAGQVLVNLLRRSTAATGGTSTNQTNVPHQATDAAATAVIKAYTANPSTGVLVGNVRATRVPLGQSTSLTSPAVFTFGDNGKPVFLAGVAQTLCVNLGGATITGGTLDIEVEFTEV